MFYPINCIAKFLQLGLCPMVPDFTWDYMSHGPVSHMGLCPTVLHVTWDYVPQSLHLGLCPMVPVSLGTMSRSPPPLGTMSHGPTSHMGLCPTVPYVTWDYVPQSHFTWDYVPWSLSSLGTICPMVPGLKWDSVLQLNKGSLNDHFPYLIIMVWSKENCPKS